MNHPSCVGVLCGVLLLVNLSPALSGQQPPGQVPATRRRAGHLLLGGRAAEPPGQNAYGLRGVPAGHPCRAP